MTQYKLQWANVKQQILYIKPELQSLYKISVEQLPIYSMSTSNISMLTPNSISN